MIFQVKHERKTGAGKFRLIPGAVAILLTHEPSNGAFDGRVIRSHGSQQANRSPGGLRSRAFSFSLERGVLIRGDGFSETAIFILDRFQPFGGAQSVWLLAETQRFERTQHTARSIDIIHAPATEPRTIRGLIVA